MPKSGAVSHEAKRDQYLAGRVRDREQEHAKGHAEHRARQGGQHLRQGQGQALTCPRVTPSARDSADDCLASTAVAKPAMITLTAASATRTTVSTAMTWLTRPNTGSGSPANQLDRAATISAPRCAAITRDEPHDGDRRAGGGENRVPAPLAASDQPQPDGAAARAARPTPSAGAPGGAEAARNPPAHRTVLVRAALAR